MENNEKAYPYTDGEVIVLGPRIFASIDRKVINWEGVNYVPQPAQEDGK